MKKNHLTISTSDHDYFKCIWQNLFWNTWFLEALYVRTWMCLERFDTSIPNESYVDEKRVLSTDLYSWYL